MAIFHGNSIPAGGGGYNIDNSLRFNKNDSAFLGRTPTVEGNRKTWTWSGWIKLGRLSTTDNQYSQIFGQKEPSNAPNNGLWLDNNGRLYTYSVGGKSGVTTQILRDPSSWYHIVVAVDTTQGTTDNRFRLYLNDDEITEWDTKDTINQNDILAIGNTSTEMVMGKRQSEDYFDGYMSEVNFIDGQQLTPSDFGQTGNYGEWKAKEYSGSYGTNGFYLAFGNPYTAHSINAVGNTQHSTAEQKIGNSSMYFPATSGLVNTANYIAIADDTTWDYGTGDFTWEMWVNVPAIDRQKKLFGSQGWSNSGAYDWIFDINPTRSLRVQLYNGSAAPELHTTTTLPVSTWTHVAATRSSGTMKIFIDGVESASATRTQSLANNGTPYLGWKPSNNQDGFVGYMDEVRLSNVARYTSGFTPSTTAFESDVNTQLLLHSDTTNNSTTFVDSSGVAGGVGHDSSGNGNHFTPTNITTSDQMTDSPTNNFATWNPLAKGSYVTFSEGNLRTDGNTTDSGNVRSTFHMTTGKWYMEVLCQDASASYFYPWIGCIGDGAQIGIPSNGGSGQIGQVTTNSCAYLNNGTMYLNGSANSSWGSSFTDGDIIGMALDADNGALYFAKNNIWQNSGNPASGASKTGAAFTWTGGSITLAFALSDYDATTISNFGQDGTFAGEKPAQGNADGNGYGNFYYAPPSSHLSLCSKNLATPTVIPSEHFNALAYTGDGSQDVTGVGFQPDLVWCKTRNNTYHHQLHDSVRGATAGMLNSNQSNAENNTFQFDSFDSDGFTTDSGNVTGINASGDPQVLYSWKANGSGSSNEDGSINTTSTSANTSAGFSISAYTGTGSNATVGHGLSKAPELVMVKRRDSASGWPIGSIQPVGSMDFTDFVRLDVQAAVSDNATIWNDTAPTSSVFSLGNNIDLNASSGTYIAYCFHSVEGFSKIGMYAGNGSSSDGTFVYTGFRPSWIMLKRIDGTSNWRSHASGNRTPPDVNGVFARLEPSNTGVEATSSSSGDLDFLSNGFKIRDGTAHVGASGNEYLYMAFAKTPFSHSNAV